MNSKIAVMLACVGAVAMVGCKTGTPVAGTSIADGAYVFTASADGVSPSPISEHEMAKARVAATVVAKAALLEKIKGAKVNSKATVGDLMLKSQEASSITRGWLSRVEITFVNAAPVLDRLGDVITPMPAVVTATATLTLTKQRLNSPRWQFTSSNQDSGIEIRNAGVEFQFQRSFSFCGTPSVGFATDTRPNCFFTVLAAPDFQSKENVIWLTFPG